LQFGVQRHQPPNTLVNIFDVAAGNSVHLSAGTLQLLAKCQQLRNVGDLEAQLAGMTNAGDRCTFCLISGF